MSTFNKKLKMIINESASTEFINNKIEIRDSEHDPCSVIAAAGPLYGLKLIDSEEGVISFVTYSKVALEQFCKYLDDSDDVELYDISVTITDPGTKVSGTRVEIDFDEIQESEFVEFNIDVAIKNQYVDFNPYYSDEDNLDWYTTEHDFEYEDDEYEDEKEFQNKSIKQDETTILISVSSTESTSPNGSFSVTVHPENPSKILIQCNYDIVPSKEEAEEDVDIINNGMFGLRFNDEFELISLAKYIEGEQSTTSAVFKAYNTKDALTIVESFEHINEIKYSHELNEIEKAVIACAFFKEHGFYAMPIRHPTVPKGKARLRLSLTASLSDDQVEQLKDTIKAFSKSEIIALN